MWSYTGSSKLGGFECTVSKRNSSADDNVKSSAIKLKLNCALMKSEEF